MTKSVCTSGGELVWISLRRSFSNVMAGVADNSTHEHEISAAKGRGGSGMRQTGGERKDEEENGEDKENFFEHGLLVVG